MPMLPNILPDVNAGGIDNLEPPAPRTAPSGPDDSFDSLMTQAQAPDDNESDERDPANFLQSPHDTRSSPQKTSDLDKDSSGQSTATSDSSHPAQSANAVDNSVLVAAQMIVPAPTPPVPSNTSATAVQNANTAAESARILSVGLQAKSSPRTTVKTSDTKVQNQPAQDQPALAATKSAATAAEKLTLAVTPSESANATPEEVPDLKTIVPQASETSVSDVKTPAPTPSNADGTPAAKQDASMKSAEKTSKIASLSGKNLPGNAPFVLRENNLPVRADQTAAAIASSYSSASVTSTAASTDTAVEVLPATDIRSPALERTQELITNYAMRLTSSNTDSLQVVIKPDTGTQLSLELRQNGGGVDAQVVMQQGDFAHLNHRWPELQQQLEQRGIRLGPLGGENDSAGGNNAFQQKQSQPSAETDSGGIINNLPLAALPNPSAAQPAASRGWETWA